MLLLAVAFPARSPNASSDEAYYPLPEPSRPFDSVSTGRGLLKTPALPVRTDFDIGFDDRAVHVRRYLRADSTLGIDSTPLWDAYYGELADYLDAARQKRREELWEREFGEQPADAAVKGSQKGTIELPVKIPEWAKRLGVAAPSLSFTGSYTLDFKAESQWSSTEQEQGTDSYIPDFSPEQHPNFTLTGKIGRLISVHFTYTDEGFGTSQDQLLQIRYAGEKPEDTEDDILQELEFGQVALSFPGSTLSGYSEQAAGLIGLRAKLRFGDLDITTVFAGEKGKQQSRSLSAGAQSKATTIAGNMVAMAQVFYLDHEVRRNYGEAGGNLQNMESPGLAEGTLQVFRRIDATERARNPGWESNIYRGRARAYDAAGNEVPAAGTEADITWLRLERNVDFTEDRGIVFLRSPSINREIAALYQTAGNGAITPRGSLNADRQVELSLLYAPSDPPAIRTLMARNRYQISSVAEIDRPGIKLRILNKDSKGTDRSIDENGRRWTEILGLEDGKGALRYNDPSVFDWEHGLLVLPDTTPFAAHGDKALYDTAVNSLAQYRSLFDLEITSRSRSSQINVGGGGNSHSVTSSECIDILPGTEVLTLNGSTRLTRGIDYDVNYPFGQITLLSERALDPAADVRLEYQCTPFFSLETKTVAGTRLEYRMPWLGEESMLGGTLLYRGQTVTSDRPLLGREPNQALLWGGNLTLGGTSEALTDLADRVPLVTPRGESKWRFEVEAAQSWNNPNTGSEAVVDDFEASKLESSLPLERIAWHQASPPGGFPLDDGAIFDSLRDYRRQTMDFLWHSNTQEALERIYPDHDDGDAARAQQSLLTLRMKPNDYGAGWSWGGIMRPLPIGNASSWRSIELVVYPLGGEMFIDLGRIGEDLSVSGEKPNGALDAEDIDTTGAVDESGGRARNDLGLDGLEDTGEKRVRWICAGACVPNEVQATGTQDPGGDNYDPEQTRSSTPDITINGTQGNNRYVGNGSGSSYDTEDLDRDGSLNTRNRFSRYRIKFAGTDATPYERLRGNWRLYRIPIEAVETRVNGGASPSDFTTIRMFYTGITPANLASPWDWRDLKIARLALVGNQWSESGRLVRNDSIDVLDSTATGDWTSRRDSLIRDSSRLSVGVVNRRDNPQTYVSALVPIPEDPDSKALLNEQSLRLTYRDLPGSGLEPDSGTAVQELGAFEGADFTLYKRLVLLVYHDLLDSLQSSGNASLDRHAVRLGVQFGSGSRERRAGDTTNLSYYEYSLDPEPVRCPRGDRACAESDSSRVENQRENWRRNRIEMPMSLLTSLKDSGTSAERRRRIVHRLVPLDALPPDIDTSRRDSVAISGDPSLGNVQWIRFWVRAQTGMRRSGEIWINDLRLEGATSGLGSALRASASVNFADLLSTSTSASYTEGDFVPMGQAMPTASKASSEASATATATLGIHKFMPEAWKVTLPVTVTANGSVKRPWAVPGSDRPLARDGLAEILDDAFSGDIDRTRADIDARAPRAYQTLHFERKLSTSWRKERGNGEGLGATAVNLLFERPTLNWSYGQVFDFQPQARDTTYGHDINLTYDFTPPAWSWKPLAKLPQSWPRFLQDLSLSPSPTALRATLADFGYTENYRNVFTSDSLTEIPLRHEFLANASLSHTANLEWSPLNFATVNYDLSLARLYDRTDEATRLDPGRLFPGAGDLVFALDTTVLRDGRRQEFGILRNENMRSHTFGVALNPEILSWLTTSGTYGASSSLSRESPVALKPDSLAGRPDTVQYQYWRLDVQDQFQAELGLKLPDLLGRIGELGRDSSRWESAFGGAQRGLDRLRLNSVNFRYSVQNRSDGNRNTLDHMDRLGMDGWSLVRHQIGLGPHGWRSPWDLVTGSRRRSGPHEGFGQYQPERLNDITVWNNQKSDIPGQYNYSTLANTRTYSTSTSTSFLVPGVDLTVTPELGYDLSFVERWESAYNVDTSRTWPRITVNSSFANFAPKFSFLKRHFQSATASNTTTLSWEETLHPHSSTADNERTTLRLDPILGVNLRTKGNWTWDNRIRWTQGRGLNYAKVAYTNPAEIPEPWRGTRHVYSDPKLWFHRLAPSEEVSLGYGDELTASYRLQTKKGIQILKWFVKLDNDLNITGRAAWDRSIRYNVARTLVDPLDQLGPTTAKRDTTEDLTTVYVGAQADYSFTSNLTAKLQANYSRKTTVNHATDQKPIVQSNIFFLAQLAWYFR